MRERDGAAGRPATDVFEADEQPIIAAVSTSLEGSQHQSGRHTARQKNPHMPGSLAHAAWVCARLGGWTGYYGKPGPVVMLHGMLRLQAMIEGFRLAGNVMARARPPHEDHDIETELQTLLSALQMSAMCQSGRVGPGHDGGAVNYPTACSASELSTQRSNGIARSSAPPDRMAACSRSKPSRRSTGSARTAPACDSGRSRRQRCRAATAGKNRQRAGNVGAWRRGYPAQRARDGAGHRAAVRRAAMRAAGGASPAWCRR